MHEKTPMGATLAVLELLGASATGRPTELFWSVRVIRAICRDPTTRRAAARWPRGTRTVGVRLARDVSILAKVGSCIGASAAAPRIAPITPLVAAGGPCQFIGIPGYAVNMQGIARPFPVR
jgi:hypothetical protein